MRSQMRSEPARKGMEWERSWEPEGHFGETLGLGCRNLRCETEFMNDWTPRGHDLKGRLFSIWTYYKSSEIVWV